jgi:hypothetical protein
MEEIGITERCKLDQQEEVIHSLLVSLQCDTRTIDQSIFEVAPPAHSASRETRAQITPRHHCAVYRYSLHSLMVRRVENENKEH